MKKILKIFSLVSIIVVSSIFSTVFATNAEVQINGEIIDFTDENGNKVNAQIVNSRTMVPLRKIFEVLGCEIEWDGETKTVVATKENKEIILQIDNLEAVVTEDGNEKKIRLDTAPIIIENRTMVPLRFIAESLEKQVGWDSSAYTAIIVDYDYFANKIKEKNPTLYEMMTNESNTSFTLTKNYIDKQNSALNTTSILKGNVNVKENYSEVALEFSGTDELIKDIISEGWNNISYQAQYTNEDIKVKTSNETLQRMLDLNAENYVEFKLDKMNLIGNAQDEIPNYIANLFQVEDTSLNINTFSKLNQDFDIFLKLFVENGSRDIKTDIQKMSLIDFSKLDNMIYNNEIVRTIAFINQTIFRYDVTRDEFLYDWNIAQYTVNCQKGKVILQLVLENEYNERVEYTLESL